MEDLDLILGSPAATVVFFYVSLAGLLAFGTVVSWLQSVESRRSQPARRRGAVMSRR